MNLIDYAGSDERPMWRAHIQTLECCATGHGHARPEDAARHMGEVVAETLIEGYRNAANRPGSWASIREAAA